MEMYVEINYRKLLYWSVGLSLAFVAFLLWKHFTPGPGVVVDRETGAEFLCDQLVIGFTPTATPEQIRTALAQVSDTVDLSVPQIRSYSVKLPGPCKADTVKSAMKRILSLEGVEYAEPNYIGHLQ